MLWMHLGAINIIEPTSSHFMDAFEPQREREVDREFWRLLRPILIWMHLGKTHWLYFVPCYGCIWAQLQELSLLRPMLWMHLGQWVLLTSSHFAMDSFGSQNSLSTSTLFDFPDKSAFGCSSSVDEERLDYVPSKFKRRLQSSFLLGVYQPE